MKRQEPPHTRWLLTEGFEGVALNLPQGTTFLDLLVNATHTVGFYIKKSSAVVIVVAGRTRAEALRYFILERSVL